jgi:hypothetical protein
MFLFNIKNQMRTATIALLLAAVNAADAAKDATKKAADAAATGAAENMACNSKTDKTGCATGLKCAIGMTPEPSKEEKAKAAKAIEDKKKADETLGKKNLAAKLVTDKATWKTNKKTFDDFTADKKKYDTAATAYTTCEAIKANRAKKADVDKCKTLGGLGWIKAGAPTKEKPETKDTKYGCNHKAHPWAKGATKVADITDTLAAAKEMSVDVV